MSEAADDDVEELYLVGGQLGSAGGPQQDVVDAEALLADDDYESALKKADSVIELGPVLARAHLVRGTALLTPLIMSVMSGEPPPPQESFKPAWIA